MVLDILRVSEVPSVILSYFSVIQGAALYHFLSVLKKLEVFGGNLLSEDDHSHWAPPYWNIMK